MSSIQNPSVNKHMSISHRDQTSTYLFTRNAGKKAETLNNDRFFVRNRSKGLKFPQWDISENEKIEKPFENANIEMLRC